MGTRCQPLCVALYHERVRAKGRGRVGGKMEEDRHSKAVQTLREKEETLHAHTGTRAHGHTGWSCEVGRGRVGDRVRQGVAERYKVCILHL